MYGGYFFLCVPYLANKREEIVDFGTEGVADAGSDRGGFRVPKWRRWIGWRWRWR